MSKNFFERLLDNGFILLDGATGTQLHKLGLGHEQMPELWVLENPNSLIEVQSKYIENGAQIIYSCTFGANPFKLAEFGKSESCEEINSELVRISRQAAKNRALVAGDIGPSGLFVEPFGQLDFESAVSSFKRQIKGLVDGGADILVIETMMDIQEARAALIAAKETCELPVMVSMTFSDDGRTLTGTPPSAAAITLQSLGADAVGCNCSTGPVQMIEYLKEMKSVLTVPLFAKPNAGLPKLVDGETIFDMSAEEFASYVPALLDAGCSMLGGCCGTTPEFIGKIKSIIKEYTSCIKKDSKNISPVFLSSLSSSRKAIFIGGSRPIAVVGERINPTGKKLMKEELKAGIFKEVRRLALEQKDKGADILDVNVGAPGVDEKTLLPEAVKILSCLVDIPLCLDSSDIEALEKALRIYPGRALINSISFEKHKIEKLLPAVAKYGAMFILLPLGDDEIPEDCETRKKYVEKIYDIALEHGFSKEDIIVDGLVMTVSSNQSAAVETLKFIEWANQNGFNTILGLSNVSFGLPERKWVNSAFLSMAAAKGLSCAICNPSEDELINIKCASDLLSIRTDSANKYISRFQTQDTKRGAGYTVDQKNFSPQDQLFEAVVKGDKEHVEELVSNVLNEKIPPQKIVDEILISAINRVGELFDKKEYYLPQLMLAAETLKKAFDFLEPLLKKDEAVANFAEKPKIIMATVKGDIHDIGKNIVTLMLRNYGFDVIDLGKDVGHEKIIETARSCDVRIIGLSALMTTTMKNMREIIYECKKAGLTKVKFMIGGAVVDQAYADEIGADGYAADAVEAVKLAKKLISS